MSPPPPPLPVGGPEPLPPLPPTLLLGRIIHFLPWENTSTILFCPLLPLEFMGISSPVSCVRKDCSRGRLDQDPSSPVPAPITEQPTSSNPQHRVTENPATPAAGRHPSPHITRCHSTAQRKPDLWARLSRGGMLTPLAQAASPACPLVRTSACALTLLAPHHLGPHTKARTPSQTSLQAGAVTLL